jgi:hypothetical protein
VVSKIRGAAADCLPQQMIDLLRVDMFFVDFDFAAHPGMTDLSTQRRHHIGQKPLHAQAHHGLREAVAQFNQLARLEHADERLAGPVARRATTRTRSGVERRNAFGQLVHAGTDDLARPQSQIHAAADQTQFVELGARIGAFPFAVTRRRRKTIATLPNAQRVLRQAGLPFDGRDGSAARRLNPPNTFVYDKHD